MSLNDGSETVGMLFIGDLSNNVLQELPISEPARPYSIKQNNWFGGSRRLNFKDDPNGFFDSYAMWVTTEGKLFPRPLEKFSLGHRYAEADQPGDLLFLDMLPGTNKYISRSFVASATSNRGQIALWLNYVGFPGILTVSLYSNSGGSPNTLLQSATVSYSDVNVYGPHFFIIETQAVTSGTTYHVVVTCDSADDQANHWQVGVDSDGAGSKYSTNGSAWSAAAYSLYYYVTAADADRQWYHFQFLGAEYKVCQYDSGAASNLYINGDRGKASAATASTLTDSASGVSGAWGTNEFAGAKIRIINGKGDGQIRTIGSNTGTVLTITVDWAITPDTTSEYVIYDTPYWREITGHGIATLSNRPVVANKVAYFPQGTANYIRKMGLDYTTGTRHKFADDGTAHAGTIATFYDPDVGLQLWVSNYGAAQVYHGTAPTDISSNTTYTAITGTTVGTSDMNITNIVGREAVYIFKEDSVWKVVKNRPVQLISGMEYTPGPLNGKAAVGASGEFWWSWNHSLVRMIGSDIRDMLNYRQGWLGMPPGRNGVPMCGVNAGGWWFFAIDGGTTNRSSIICWNGQGWFEVYRSWVAGKRIRNVYWLTCMDGRPKLYFDVGGDDMYIEFPAFAANPQLDTSISYQPFAEIVTTTFDAGEPNLEKVLHSISVLATDLSSGGLVKTSNTTIKVYYQVDDEIGVDATRGNSTWHYATNISVGAKQTGVSQTSGPRFPRPIMRGDGPKKDGNVRTLKSQDFQIDFGGINRYRLKFEIYTTVAAAPFAILAVESRGDIFNPLQYRWIATFRVDSTQVTREGDEDFSPDYVLDFLRRAHASGKVLRMRSIIPNMDDISVVVANAPVPVYQWMRADDGAASWGGMITVGLKEPG